METGWYWPSCFIQFSIWHSKLGAALIDCQKILQLLTAMALLSPFGFNRFGFTPLGYLHWTFWGSNLRPVFFLWTIWN